MLIWLAIYPLITLILFLFGDWLIKIPLVFRTLLLTLVAVPMMIYIILPFYNKLFHNWLNK
jgi:antibiotic biosynthesis monooxygenase (ABM) superfamily enzyme